MKAKEFAMCKASDQSNWPSRGPNVEKYWRNWAFWTIAAKCQIENFKRWRNKVLHSNYIESSNLTIDFMIWEWDRDESRCHKDYKSSKLWEIEETWSNP